MIRGRGRTMIRGRGRTMIRGRGRTMFRGRPRNKISPGERSLGLSWGWWGVEVGFNGLWVVGTRPVGD